MSDIWSGLSLDPVSSPSTSGDQDWLYRVNGQLHGPVSKELLAQKLINGYIPIDTPVAREDGDFHPINRVAVFAADIKVAKKRATQRAARRRRMGLTLLLLPVLAGGGVGSYFIVQQVRQARLDREAALAKEREALEAKRAEYSKQKKLKVVSLVSFGSTKDVKIRSTPSTSSNRGKAGGRRSSRTEGASSSSEMVSSCQRSQAEIQGVLVKHLRKLNVCVVDEKSRDKQGLLPAQLVLAFVVTPSGKVVDFAIGDRHYRTGALKNCMTKVFNTIRYPAASGSNCPIDIPLNIGG